MFIGYQSWNNFKVDSLKCHSTCDNAIKYESNLYVTNIVAEMNNIQET